ncbi:MAG TPA: suppressor of fused domain protein [Steroidobacteraceae bacterium]|nr:suppressor of fused domain protein [Steroidobacteraceae bacterium]
MSDTWLQQIRSHVERYIGRIDRVFPGDPASGTADVLHVKPIDSRPYHTLITAGMSSVAMPVPPEVSAPHRLELMMTLPEGWKPEGNVADDLAHWPTRLLQSLSLVPREAERWLGWGHTIRNGEPPQPYASSTELCGVIIAPSLIVPVGFYELNIDGERVAFYAAIPLYREELDLKQSNGMEVLLGKLVEKDINDIVYLKRRNVAKKKRFGLF